MARHPDFLMHYTADEIDVAIQKVMAETYFNYLGEKDIKYPTGDDGYSFIFPKAERGDWFYVNGTGHDGGPGKSGVDVNDGDIFLCLFSAEAAPFSAVASRWLWLGKTIDGYEIYLNGYKMAYTNVPISDNDTIKTAFSKLEGRLSAHSLMPPVPASLGGLDYGHVKNGGDIIFGLDGTMGVIDDVEFTGYPRSETDLNNLQPDDVVTIEYLKSRIHLSTTEYGIRRKIDGSSPSFERIKKIGLDVLYDVNYTTEVGTGAISVTNDFDDIYPWKDMRRCNVNSTGEPVAYEGDPLFSLTGSNGPVMVEIPLFYQRYQYNPNNDGYEYWWISNDYSPGYYLNPRFIYKSRLYVGAYLATRVENGGATNAFLLTSDGVVDPAKNYVWNDASVWNDQYKWTSNESYLTSKTGVMPSSTYARDTMRKAAKAISSAFSIMDIHTWNILEYLFWIEFATLNSQEKMAGYTAITNTTMINNGETDSVSYVSGSYQSNSDGLHPMKYRGIENLYGMMDQLIDGVIVENNEAYINDDPTKYKISIDSNYIKSSSPLPSKPGYIDKLANDSENHLLPAASDGSSTTNTGDYYNNDNNPSEKNVLMGGRFNDGSKAGLSAFNTKVYITDTGTPFVTRIIC